MLVWELMLVVLMADFVSGFVHWAEDAYARPDMPWLKKIAEENLLHHQRPRDFLRNTWWQSSYDLMLIGAVVLLLASWFNSLTWHVVLFVVLSVNANQVHKWAHRNRTENPRWVVWLQKTCLLQTPRHHSQHHRGNNDTHYCVLTNLLNPVLDRVKFWRVLEVLISRLTGVQPRLAMK